MRASRDTTQTEGDAHSFYVRVYPRDVLGDQWVITVVHIPTNTTRSTTRVLDIVAFIEKHLGQETDHA